MRRALGTAIATALLITGCGGDDAGGQARTVEPVKEADPTTSTSTTTSPTGLADVVLRLDDMPTGWTVATDTGDEDDSFCGEEQAEPGTERAESMFQQSDMGPFVVAIAERYATDEDAQQGLDFFAEQMAECDGYTDPDDGTEWSIAALSFPGLGDDTWAARLAATTMLGPFTVDIALTRVDDVLLLVTHGGLVSADTDQTEQWQRTMIDRL